jgi:DNA-binding MarR family transcriptional regulator
MSDPIALLDRLALAETLAREAFEEATKVYYIRYRLLQSIGASPDLRVAEHTAVMGFKARKNMTYNVAKLERLGMIERWQPNSLDDRRGVYFRLTPKGQTALSETTKRGNAALKEILQAPQLRDLQRTLQSISKSSSSSTSVSA